MIIFYYQYLEDLCTHPDRKYRPQYEKRINKLWEWYANDLGRNCKGGIDIVWVE